MAALQLAEWPLDSPLRARGGHLTLVPEQIEEEPLYASTESYTDQPAQALGVAELDDPAPDRIPPISQIYPASFGANDRLPGVVRAGAGYTGQDPAILKRQAERRLMSETESAPDVSPAAETKGVTFADFMIQNSLALDANTENYEAQHVRLGRIQRAGRAIGRLAGRMIKRTSLPAADRQPASQFMVAIADNAANIDAWQ